MKKRVIFIGRKNTFNNNIINWLSIDYEVVAAYYVELNRFDIRGKYNRLVQRLKKYGAIKVIDELIFHVFDRFYLRKNEDIFTQRSQFMEYNPNIIIPTYNIEDVNNNECLKLTSEFKPDFIFSVNTTVVFSKELYSIPKYGALFLHKGVAPEYRGLHTTLWALLNRDYKKIGCTLFKVNDIIDKGSIIAQYNYHIGPDEGLHCWGYISHNAIIYNLPKLSNAINEYLSLYANYKYLDTNGRKSKYYTWVGISDYILAIRKK